MSHFFKKAAVFTDFHHGRSNNSPQANQDNNDFIDWFVDEAKTFGAETFIFCGDWNDHRHNLQVATLQHSLRNIERLSNAFHRCYFIVGNHDSFFRERVDVNSLIIGRNLSNVEIVEQPIVTDDVAIIPWLVGDKWKEIKNIKSRYIFGHFELPNFMLNSRIEMPDHGGLNAKHFAHQEFVFSGHYHQRQTKGNVVYIGNTFPFNFSDAWDADRGAMFLEHGKEPFFKTWPDQPLYRTCKLSELVNEPGKILAPKSTIRATLDLDISFEEATFLRDTFCAQYGARKIDLVNLHKEEADQQYDPSVVFQSVDQIVIDGLTSVDSNGVDTGLLIDIYKGL